MKSFVEDGKQLKAVFGFTSFLEAIDFVNQIADLAIQADHHPDIHLEKGSQVTVCLSTHDADGVTDKDKDMAEQIEAIAPNAF